MAQSHPSFPSPISHPPFFISVHSRKSMSKLLFLPLLVALAALIARDALIKEEVMVSYPPRRSFLSRSFDRYRWSTPTWLQRWLLKQISMLLARSANPWFYRSLLLSSSVFNILVSLRINKNKWHTLVPGPLPRARRYGWLQGDRWGEYCNFKNQLWTNHLTCPYHNEIIAAVPRNNRVS